MRRVQCPLRQGWKVICLSPVHSSIIFCHPDPAVKLETITQKVKDFEPSFIIPFPSVFNLVPLLSLAVLFYKAKLKMCSPSQNFGCKQKLQDKHNWFHLTAVMVASLKLGYTWLGLHFTVWFELFLIVSLQKQIWRSKVRFVPLLVKTWFTLLQMWAFQ